MRNTLLILVIGMLLAACGQTEMGNFQPGLVDNCRGMPQFLAKTGLGNQVALDTRQRGYIGLRLLAPATGKAWQDPGWDDGGHVGAFDRDRAGNIYVVATPEVSLSENPPELQNRIYRIDTLTGKMALWLELPAAAPPSVNNPFGALGLFFDCDTDSLYASSVAGSSPREVLGRIYRVDVSSGKVVDQFEGMDAISVGVFNGVRHKRLYMGSARSADVYSVALDAKGDFTRDFRHEFSLSSLPNGNTTSVRRFEFKRSPQGEYLMQAKEVEFGFRLPAENNLRKRVYHFRYDPRQDAWQFLNTTPEPVG